VHAEREPRAERRTADGGRCAANDERRTANDERRTTNGERRTANGVYAGYASSRRATADRIRVHMRD
jgi:hypothetical protein